MDSLLEKEESHKIIGEIYKITNLITNKMYIGQTRSHYLNNGKYRPFGYMGRFKKHLNEASRININCSCRYLNSTINKYGATNFKCELITTCYINDLDYYEIKYISELNTKYPNGYNLTNGGQKCGFEKGKKIALTYGEVLFRAGNFSGAYKQFYLLEHSYPHEPIAVFAKKREMIYNLI